MGVQTGAATVESSIEIPQKIKNGTAFWPSDPTSGNIFKGTQNTNLKEHKHPYVHCNIFYHWDMEAAQVSVSRWVDETTMAHLYNGILLSCKKNKENFTLCDSMDGPGEHFVKWNKPIGERQIPYDFTHVESNEQTTNKQNRDRLIVGEQMTASGRVRLGVGGIEQKKKKDSWTRTTVWWLLGGGDIRGLKGNVKKTIKIKLKKKNLNFLWN